MATFTIAFFVSATYAVGCERPGGACNYIRWVSENAAKLKDLQQRGEPTAIQCTLVYIVLLYYCCCFCVLSLCVVCVYY